MIEFAHSGEAEMVSIVPGTMYQEGTTVVTDEAKDQYDLYRTMRAMMNLADTVTFF